MGKISENLEEVGFNNATVMMDVDALVRESMIKMFKVKDDSGELMDPYNDKYYESGLPGVDEPGAPSIIRQFILLECKMLGFLFQQFLYITKPIQIALELGSYLSDPKKLAEKIKEIIQSIKDLIDDITEFFTDTKNWFFDKLLGEIMDVNIPIPEIPFKIMGIGITIPSIDNLDLFGKEPYLENIIDKLNKDKADKIDQKKSDKVKSNKEKIAKIREKLQTLKDKSNVNINGMQLAILGTLMTSLTLLVSVLWEEMDDFYDIAYKIHLQVLKKQKLVKEKLVKNNVKKTSMVNSSNQLLIIKTDLDKYTENSKGIKIYSDEDRLIEIYDELLEIIDDEEQSTTDVINKYKLEKDKTFKSNIDKIDNEISKLYQQLTPLRYTIDNTREEINMKQKEIDKIKENMRDFVSAGAVVALASLSKELQDLKDEIADLSPASIWMEQVIDMVIGVIKSPIDLVIGLLSKLFEGVLQFLEELPLPSFEKIKEFFSDLVSLPNVDKMGEVIAGFLSIPENLSETLKNLMEFLPWLFTTTAKEFVTGVATPLPIPI